MKKYIQLIRVKHYIKNLLIFLPIVFSKKIYVMDDLIKTIIAFIIFCIITSIVYIFNDIRDVEKDKKHPKKRFRPLASGKITKKQAIATIILLSILCIIMTIVSLKDNIYAILLLIIYLLLNILYSIKLKNIPIVDITILAIGFLIRVVYGSVIISIEISNWLYLTILSLSFYMGMGKRRNEFIKQDKKDETREVLKQYSENFLNENMYMFLALSIVFYSLWTLEMSTKLKYIIYTIPLVIIIALKYSLDIEKESDGDPVDVIFVDRILITLSMLLAIILGIMLYNI